MSARPCSVCGMPMAAGQRGRDSHYACDPLSTVGERCTCPIGCTDTIVGDGGSCSPTCIPCRLHAGVPHKAVPEWQT